MLSQQLNSLSALRSICSLWLSAVAWPAFLPTTWAREAQFNSACLWVIVGAAGMLGSAGSFTAYVACKCIGAIGLGHIMAMSSTYGVECAPPRKRGLLITIYAAGGGVGNVVVSAVCLGSSSIPSSWSWENPLSYYRFLWP